MSTKDISRFLFQPKKHYVGMRMQQGRVLIDSDHNEGASHDDEDQRQTLLALVGPQATPDAGFAIGYVSSDGFGGTPQVVTPGATLGVTQVNINGSSTPVSVPNFYVMPGSMFVGGLRVQMEQPEHIAFQNDYLSLTENLLPPDISSSATVSHHFFFLHVWEQCVTAVEDEEILEHALGGPDTSVRVRRMRRVEYAEAFDGEDCHVAFMRAIGFLDELFATLDAATGEFKSSGRLRLGFLEGDSEDTCAPCHPDPSGRYLGAENQAIRIMLTDQSHFVWAYDNAAPLYRATVGGVGDPPAGLVVVTMLTLPKDEEHWPLQGRVVEVVPWSAILENGEKVAEEVGVFCRVSRSYDPATKTFEIDTGDATAMAALADLVHAWDDDHPRLADLGDGSEPRPFYLRFWHQTASGTTDVTIPTNSTAGLGSTGIVPQFPTPGRRGDFWIAALRPETPNRVVPFDLQDNPDGVPPHGPRHFYAPLMLIHSANNVVTGVEDCRKPLIPVTDTGCCAYTVGDGVHSVGQFTSIQAAIDALPPEGGEVCVRPGLYREEFSIHNRVDVVVSGCGAHTIIESPANPTADALVEVTSGKRFTVRSLTIRAMGQKAIWVHSMESPRLLDLQVEAFVQSGGPPIPDEAPVVHISSNADVLVRTLEIFASRRTGLLLEQMGPLQVPEPSGFSGTFVRPVILSGVTIRGARDGAAPNAPLAIVRSGSGSEVWGLVRLEHWNLAAFGQTALQCEQVKLELTQSVILSKPFSATQPAKACLDMNQGQLVVRHCSFLLESTAGSVSAASEHAAIVLRHGDMIVENNEIRASSLAWGGIQVAGGTGPVAIRGNQIDGGAGHGITLGSVLWYRSGSDPTLASRREGAGRVHMNPASGQVSGNLRPGFTDPNDGFLYLARVEGGNRDLEIIDNTIMNMGTNGISVLTLFGVPLDQPLMATKGSCRIKNNRIRANLRNASPNVPLAEPLFPVGGSRFGALAGNSLPMRMLPFGGIVLGPSTLSSPGPIGLFKLDISGNTIDDNGNEIFGSTTHVSMLPVSGIVVTGGDSIRVADNVIAGNGALTQPTDLLQTGLRAGIAVLMAGAGEGTREQIAAFFNDNVSHPPSSCSLQVSGNRVEQREGRALYAVGTGPMAIQDNFFSSLGFHGSIASPEALAEIFALGDVVYVHNLGRPWEAAGLPTTGGTDGLPPNNSQIISGAIVYLKDQASSYGWGNLFFVGLGGHTLFTDNQVVYDWTVKQVGSEPLSYAPVALVSLDNMAVRSNQFAFRLDTQGLTLPTPPLPPGTQGFGGRPVLSQVLVVGHMVDVSNNRVAEGLSVCEASIFSIGRIANISTRNFGTHCITAVTPTMQALDDSGNMSMITPNATCTGVRDALFGLVDDFLFLLNDRR
jgi:hypothetical protein